MKKKFLVLVIALICVTTYSIASERIAQFIVTECGTVHQIPDDSDINFAIDMLDYWTSVDC